MLKSSFDIELDNALISLNIKSASQVVRELYPELTESEQKALSKSIRRYRNCNVVPDLSTALNLMNKLGVKFSDEEMIDLLHAAELRRSSYKYQRKKTRYRKSLDLDYDIMRIDGVSDVEMEMMIENRIYETTSRNSFNEYIAKLIKNDLEYLFLERVLKNEENEGEDK